jgi:hypothetical protein
MRASNEIQIYNFQERFESAASELMRAADLASFGATATVALPEENVRVAFAVGPVADQVSRKPNGDLVYSKYENCSLEIEVAYPRDGDTAGEDAEKKLNEAAAIIRVLLQWCRWPFHDENLLYYRVTKIRPSGETRGIDEGANLDLISLKFSVDFEIMPDAWPLG